jgi:hypothetical protein
MRLQPSAKSLAEFEAVALGFKLLPKELRRDLNATVRDVLNPIWRDELAERLSASGANRLDSAIFAKGARVAAGNPARVMAATSRRPLRKGEGGLRPDTQGRSFEFGADDKGKTSTYEARSSKGKPYKVTRRTRAGMPAQARAGRIVYPAWAHTAPRIVSLWVSLTVKKFYEAFEGK